jgi:TetR/AcrR family transcriptional regulator
MQTYCQTNSSNAGSRELQRTQSRELILNAAVDVFAKLGFEAASFADVAVAAGVKKSLVQYHFPNKENLWQSAVAHLWQRRDQELTVYLSDVPSENNAASLRDVFTGIARFNRSHPQWLSLMFRESSSPGPRLNWLIEHYLQDDIARGTAFIEKAQQAGLLPLASPLQLLHLISGMLSYNLLVAPMTKQATGVDLAGPDSIEAQVDIMMQLLQPARP